MQAGGQLLQQANGLVCSRVVEPQVEHGGGAGVAERGDHEYPHAAAEALGAQLLRAEVVAGGVGASVQRIPGTGRARPFAAGAGTSCSPPALHSTAQRSPLPHLLLLRQLIQPTGVLFPPAADEEGDEAQHFARKHECCLQKGRRMGGLEFECVRGKDSSREEELRGAACTLPQCAKRLQARQRTICARTCTAGCLNVTGWPFSSVPTTTLSCSLVAMVLSDPGSWGAPGAAGSRVAEAPPSGGGDAGGMPAGAEVTDSWSASCRCEGCPFPMHAVSSTCLLDMPRPAMVSLALARPISRLELPRPQPCQHVGLTREEHTNSETRHEQPRHLARQWRAQQA